MCPNDPGRAPLVELIGVSKTYQMGDVLVVVLQDIDLDIAPNDLMVVVGPSGSGKSTLLNIIGGIDVPTTGRVLFRGQDIAELSSAERTEFRRRHVGFVFQFYNLVSTLTARENVMVTAEICEDPLDVDDVLELVGLKDRADHFPSQLSGGEQQRVAIARALVKRPSLLLCDEPTGALDLETGRRVLRAIVDSNQRLGTTVLIITHNSAIAQLARRVVRLGSGTIAETKVNKRPAQPESIAW